MVIPCSLGYDKSNGKVRTKSVNSIFSCIPEIAKELKKTKNGKPVKSNQFSSWVTSRVNSSSFIKDMRMLNEYVVFLVKYLKIILLTFILTNFY